MKQNEKKEERIKGNEDSLIDLWDNVVCQHRNHRYSRRKR